MNIIFLDVDGVLNSRKHAIEVFKNTNRPLSGFNYPFDDECLKNLKMIIGATKAKIVITSTWRKDDTSKKILSSELEKYDLKTEIIGYTPILNNIRGLEIAKYLSELEFEPNFIILDDDSDMLDLLPYLVKVDGYVGLTYDNAIEAIRKLDGDKKILTKKK